MQIGIDAHAIGAQQGGNETYIRNLIKALAAIDSENRYTIYLAQPDAAVEWREGFARQFPNFSIRLLPKPTPIVRVPVFLAYELRRRPVDVLHVQYTAPPFCPAPVVATIHDLAFEHLPETFTRRGSLQLKLTVRRTARRAARIATVSEYSRQDLLRTYGLPPEKVVVTYNGVESHFTPDPAGPDEAAAIRARFQIGREYLLAVGSLQPRKNLVRLIRTYAKLRAERPGFTPQLVIVGRKLWLADSIFDEVKRQPWADDVILTGYVTDADLPALYRGAAAFVYPSIFEGFGLPPLEAMACGTPVVTSNTSSLPEVTGDAALLVDPYSEDQIADALLQITGDDALRSRLRAAGLEQAKRFTWRDAAARTLQLYRESKS
jgi:glycosyltransferase involved in cell wall biosynthesis